jgi:hypothetical protein
MITMTISRSEAITLCSFYKMLYLDKEQFKDELESVLAELEVEEEAVSEEGKTTHLRAYLAGRFERYSNSYLEIFLRRYLNLPLNIIGAPPLLYPCPCCGYKTLEDIGQYFICPVCFWEDDGSRNVEKMSVVNRMILGEAQKNFIAFKAMGEGSLRFLDEDRFLQFEKK